MPLDPNMRWMIIGFDYPVAFTRPGSAYALASATQKVVAFKIRTPTLEFDLDDPEEAVPTNPPGVAPPAGTQHVEPSHTTEEARILSRMIRS